MFRSLDLPISKHSPLTHFSVKTERYPLSQTRWVSYPEATDSVQNMSHAAGFLP